MGRFATIELTENAASAFADARLDHEFVWSNEPCAIQEVSPFTYRHSVSPHLCNVGEPADRIKT